jgi:hypothetical protein
MKHRRLAIVPAIAVILAACSPTPYRRIAIEVPALSPIGIDSYKEIVVTDFTEAEPVPDLHLGRKLAEYLETELRRAFKGTVSRRPVFQNAEAVAADRDFWRSAGAGLKDAVFLSGTVRLGQEAQKALRETDLPADGPFKLENRGLAERKRFTLTLECLLADAASGQLVMKKELKETRLYGDVQQTPEFALADLLPIITGRLFVTLFGRPSVEQRYLLLR